MVIYAFMVIMGHTPSQKLMELHDSTGDEMGCANLWALVWGDPISHEVWDMHHSMPTS